MLGYQGMVCLAGNQIWWTWEVEDVSIKVKQGQKQAMKLFAKKLNKQIDELVQQVCVSRCRSVCVVMALTETFNRCQHYRFRVGDPAFRALSRFSVKISHFFRIDCAVFV